MWLNQPNIFIERWVVWLMGVNISIICASMWFFPLGCYIPQSRVRWYSSIMVLCFYPFYSLQNHDNSDWWEACQTSVVGHERSGPVLHNHPFLLEGGSGHSPGLRHHKQMVFRRNLPMASRSRPRKRDQISTILTTRIAFLCRLDVWTFSWKIMKTQGEKTKTQE